MGLIESLSIEDKRRIVCKIVAQLTDFTEQEAEKAFDKFGAEKDSGAMEDYFKSRLVKAVLNTSRFDANKEDLIKAKMSIVVKDAALGLVAMADEEFSNILMTPHLPDAFLLKNFFLMANTEKYFKITDENRPIWYIKGC